MLIDLIRGSRSISSGGVEALTKLSFKVSFSANNGNFKCSLQAAWSRSSGVVENNLKKLLTLTPDYLI